MTGTWLNDLSNVSSSTAPDVPTTTSNTLTLCISLDVILRVTVSIMTTTAGHFQLQAHTVGICSFHKLTAPYTDKAHFSYLYSYAATWCRPTWQWLWGCRRSRAGRLCRSSISSSRTCFIFSPQALWWPPYCTPGTVTCHFHVLLHTTVYIISDTQYHVIW